jgi:uncharacterized membrane protein YdjX (TVP38/TMEM64 family)
VKWLRLLAVVVVLGGVVLIGHTTGLGDLLTKEALRAQVERAGAWGVPVFIGAFCLALLLHVPATGIMFVGIAVALYGRLAGGSLAFAGSVVAVMVSFFVVRGIGGRPLAEVKNRVMRRILDRLASHPVLTVFVLRLLFFAGAPVNYALALSSLRTRDYAVGSVIGLALPAAVLTAFFDLLMG